MLVTVYVPNMLMFVRMHDLAQGDDPDPIGSQPQEKQQLLPEDLPERFYVTWLGEEKQFSAILQGKWAIRIYTQCIYNIL